MPEDPGSVIFMIIMGITVLILGIAIGYKK